MRAIFVLIFSCLFSTAALSQNLVPAQGYQFLQTEDLKIAYRVFGKGEPLILINGGPGRSSDSFTELAGNISHLGVQVILFDQRGTGRSQLDVVNDQTVTMAKMIDDLEAIRKHLGAEKVLLLGHSFGGMYAMSYAAKFPEHVKALILSESGGLDLSWQGYTHTNMLSRLSPEKRAEYEYWTDPKQIENDEAKARMEALRILLPAYLYDQKYLPQIEAALLNPQYVHYEINGLVWQDLTKRKYNLSGAFKGIQIPTLIIACRQDFLGEQVPLSIHQEIGGSQLEFLNECSHYPFIEKPTAYFSLVKSVLRKSFKTKIF